MSEQKKALFLRPILCIDVFFLFFFCLSNPSPLQIEKRLQNKMPPVSDAGCPHMRSWPGFELSRWG